MRPLVLFFAILANLSAYGAYQGTLEFTEEEIRNHKDNIEQLVSTARSCLLTYRKRHIRFHRRNCISDFFGKKKCLSRYYGERRYTKVRGQRRSDGKKLEFLPEVLEKEGFPSQWSKYLEATSCVGIALDCLGQGFKKTGQEDQWRRLLDYVKENNVGGTSLQDGLQKIGWKIYYWNPSHISEIQKETKKWDREERRWESKGYHNYRYNNVMNKGMYWFNKVDNKSDLVGFGDRTPRILRNFGYWIGTANTGYHVFPGTFGEVVEAHSTRHITSVENLEFSKFNPFGTGGGPRWSRSEKYRSGLIAFPPLY